MHARLPLLSSLLLAWLPAAATTPAPDNVRIYRCVGSNGALALQDSPCRTGRQQVLEMQRPHDPPPRLAPVPVTAVPSPSAPVPAREIRIVTVQPPQPMYECITSEGARYTSDAAEGNPRWVPVWGYGYPVPPRGPGPHLGHSPRPPGPRPPSGDPPTHRPSLVAPVGSTLVRDTCHALPPQEVCARLKDRRWELIRRYNSALQSEREQLVREQRGIDARLEQDCGGA
ncbi:DUF4124 domain-containing protein [Stenotrophomonas sp. YIM B06876]|uniref:DUF4124 domain-containing protein n=1 Tax=Stenotrophomonas sp. YIM B06876 TaxID=3060211 RepID=UPI0027386C51|nr:DUF4124 domain-containing protein [Stenotrophomonas sp. YIM B06876]